MFLVVDERGLSELGGYLMIQKLTRPCTVTSIDFNNPSAFKGISKHTLLLIDNSRLESLVSAVITAVDAGYFKRCAVLLLLDSSVAASNEELTRLNVRIRALWSAGLAVIKPWNGFLARTGEGNFQTGDIGDIAARVDQAIKRMPKLLSNPATRLVGVHRTGRCIFNGPKAPLTPNVEILKSKEQCEYVRAVVESNTAEDAIKAWAPASSPKKKLKRLNHKAKETWGSSRGSGRGRGSSRGRGGSSRGRRGGRGGFHGASRKSQGPTFTGIHYHNW